MTNRTVSTLAIAFVVIAAAPRVATQTDHDKLDIRAFAVNMNNVATGANAIVQITIDRWSTPDERATLVSALQEKGPDGLLRELERMPSHGRFRIPGLQGADTHNLRLGWNLQYTQQMPQPDGGRRIVIATDRYIGFEEERAQPRTIDYPFTLFEIRVDASGKGEGRMAAATKITFDKATNTMHVENYGTAPVLLNNVEVTVRH